MSLDERRRIDRQAELLRELAHALLGAALVEQDAPARLDPEHDVLGHRHHRDEHEVLVHHADPGLDRIRAEPNVTGFPVQEDLPSSGLYSP